MSRFGALSPYRATGRVHSVAGLEITVRGITARIGDRARIHSGDRVVDAEVISVDDDAVRLLPFAHLGGLASGDVVEPTGAPPRLAIGPGTAGRILDGLGVPIDGRGALAGPIEMVEADGETPHPLERRRIDSPLSLGVRSIDTLLTCGRGQRVAILAGSGVGKSTLLGMIARGTAADVVIVALVGERGREVREFIEDDLGDHARSTATIVVATSDEAPLMRLAAVRTATRIAEWHADQGRDALLLVDSLTRVAMAQREVGLAAGEPPTTRGYTPSVFALLPRLLERSGPRRSGTITAIYTVLVEGDDMDEPITDHVRSILDGHIVLSRRLAQAGQYPTIDVLASASRLMGRIVPPDRLACANRFRELLAAYDESRDLVEIGAYVAGTNRDTDEAIRKRDAMRAFLVQDVNEITDPDEAWQRLAALVA